MSEEQREIIDMAIENGVQSNLWTHQTARVIIKGEPTFELVNDDLEYGTNLPAKFGGRGSIYSKDGWPDYPRIRVIYLQVDDELGVFILSQTSLDQCIYPNLLDYILKEF